MVAKHLAAKHRKPRARKRQSRIEVAERIADQALVFVGRARTEGCANTVTPLLIEEIAQSLGCRGERHFTFSTAKRAVVRLARERGLEEPLVLD